jgi:hypothetical protein
MAATTTLPELTAAAVDALTGDRWAIPEAVRQVPARPGLYAIYGGAQAWRDLQLDPAPETPLYVGKAERSLAARDLSGHFATDPEVKPRTGSSTVRRSFAALLRDALGLHAVPRNPSKPERFSNYALAEGGDGRLTAWMHARLTLAVWPSPARMPVPLGAVEAAVIVHFTPPINISNNPGRLPLLRRARAAMALEAASWDGSR